ncbi:uncharacterized protein BDZ99DRAFT_467139 [Mytilinidion resinicola]|uniref:Uncharacterized protein n=1 Tax=Mytilinidion resinicola TaxID=574789 RepID=A0A6A6Y7V0_9PEZI|nr:uncharacterized protein BDZ99DRAFT_467139 [Mytilinidion resinicola]KAF2804906.1 hypothetical protein BDZ99DRAFT_467139 [Mytilinidion resinicola]
MANKGDSNLQTNALLALLSPFSFQLTSTFLFLNIIKRAHGAQKHPKSTETTHPVASSPLMIPHHTHHSSSAKTTTSPSPHYYTQCNSPPSRSSRH